MPKLSRILKGLALISSLGVAPVASAHEPSIPYTETAPRIDERILGAISYYSHRLAGRATASGERFDPKAMTMAHPTLPFGTQVRVTMPHSDRSVVVRVNDRGPVGGSRVADVSPAAARVLGFMRRGLASVHLEVLSSTAGSQPASSRSDH